MQRRFQYIFSFSILFLSAQALAFAPAPPHPTPTPTNKRIAIVGADWGDPGLNSEADAVIQGLKARGWDTRKIGEKQADQMQNGPLVSAILAREAQDAGPGDQVFFDLQAHGAPGDRDFSYQENGHTSVWHGDYFGALALPGFENSLSYPYSDDPYWSNHWTTAMVPNGAWGLNLKDISAVLDSLQKRGVRVGFADHSCEGGNSVLHISTLNPAICAVATDGQMTPGLVAYPAISQIIRTSSDLGAIADWISVQYQNGSHLEGTRVFSIGYKTGCHQTMPVRETADMSTYAYGTWWDWQRVYRNHILREPGRYGNPNSSEPSKPLADPINNPRTGISRGLQRWLKESLSQFYSQNGLTATLSGKKASQTVQNILIKGQALIAANDLTKNAFYDLELALAPSGSPDAVDEQVRNLLVRNCICKNPNHARDFGWTCTDIPDTAPQWDPANTSSYCNNPGTLVNQALKQYPDVLNKLNILKSKETASVQAIIAFSKALRPYETTCKSTACSAFKL